ncbi:MAG: DNA polymerase I [Elusimicrobia bacterium]|nr:DNA polymerase I [Elusimicrobiota bacterium]
MKPRFYLVDAHAFLHRAYHALPPLTNSKGEPVGALYGFARMLLQILKRDKPDRMAVCFDRPEPTFRHKLFPEYKATRKETDEDLVFQLKQARDMVEAMGFVCVEKAGFEADDLMATLAKAGAKDGYEAVLVTGDKDVLQLVGPGIRVFNPSKNVYMDAPQIEEKLGVGPQAVVDYLALIGDSSDNVPGVRGIGPVGAAKLLKKFGTLHDALKAAKAADPSIPPKTAQALVEGEKTAATATELITLDTKVPVEAKPSACKLPEPDAETLRAVFGRLEFGSLLKEMLPRSGDGALTEPEPAAPQASPASSGSTAAREVPFAELRAELAHAKTLTVTARRNPKPDLAAGSVLAAVGLPDGRTAVLDEALLRREAAHLTKLLSGPALKVGYDLKETRAALETAGIGASGRSFDTMLAAYCINPAESGRRASGKDLRAELLSGAAAALDHEVMAEGMDSAGVRKLFDEMEMPLSEILRGMEAAGVAVDGAYLGRLLTEFEADIAALRDEIDRLAGAEINPSSPKQLGVLLYDKLGLPVPHETAKGGRSTDEEALQILAKQHPIPAKVLDFRELAKLKSTYIDGLLARLDPKDSRVHTHFDQTGTATGRLSSLDPNLQNIPVRSPAGQRIRRAFVAREGCVLVSADYSQVDLRVLAHVSGDETLSESFRENEDIHRRTASEVFHVPPEQVDKEMRRRAKAINFGIVYGQTAFGLAAELGIPQGEAGRYIKDYLARYPGVAAWVAKNLEAARRDGLVRTPFGRIRHLPELHAKNTALRQFAERAARNTPIQGGSADIIKLAMIAVDRGLPGKWKARMLLQIHDELLFEVPRGQVGSFASWAKETMERAAKLDVPLVADVKAGENWQDMEGLK